MPLAASQGDAVLCGKEDTGDPGPRKVPGRKGPEAGNQEKSAQSAQVGKDRDEPPSQGAETGGDGVKPFPAIKVNILEGVDDVEAGPSALPQRPQKKTAAMGYIILAIAVILSWLPLLFLYWTCSITYFTEPYRVRVIEQVSQNTTYFADFYKGFGEPMVRR
jgi:hypothetical protein